MKEIDESFTEGMTDEQRAVLNNGLQGADDAAQRLVEQYENDPDLKFVANPSLIGDGINVIDNTDSSAMPGIQPTPKQIKHMKRMMAGPMMRENQPCKTFVSKTNRDKKRKMQKLSRKRNRNA